MFSIIKEIGIVGYWATSIFPVRTIVLFKIVVKTDLFPDLDGDFRNLERICVEVAVRLLWIIPVSYGIGFLYFVPEYLFFKELCWLIIHICGGKKNN